MNGKVSNIVSTTLILIVATAAVYALQGESAAARDTSVESASAKLMAGQPLMLANRSAVCEEMRTTTIAGIVIKNFTSERFQEWLFTPAAGMLIVRDWANGHVVTHWLYEVDIDANNQRIYLTDGAGVQSEYSYVNDAPSAGKCMLQLQSTKYTSNMGADWTKRLDAAGNVVATHNNDAISESAETLIFSFLK